jgi:nucleoside-diphosphate-sugar epimerase
MSVATIIAIAGLTGKMGRQIAISLLQKHPDIRIHGLVRSSHKVDPAICQSPKVKLFEASASDADALRQGLKGVSVCICCYFGDFELMTDGQKTLIDACINESVARYIASDWALDFRGLELGQHPAKDPMKLIQTYLEDKEKDSKIKAVHVLNGGFLDMVLAPFAQLLNSKAKTLTYWGSGDETLDLTTIADAAAFTAEVAADPDAVGFLNGACVEPSSDL